MASCRFYGRESWEASREVGIWGSPFGLLPPSLGGPRTGYVGPGESGMLAVVACSISSSTGAAARLHCAIANPPLGSDSVAQRHTLWHRRPISSRPERARSPDQPHTASDDAPDLCMAWILAALGCVWRCPVFAFPGSPATASGLQYVFVTYIDTLQRADTPAMSAASTADRVLRLDPSHGAAVKNRRRGSSVPGSCPWPGLGVRSLS